MASQIGVRFHDQNFGLPNNGASAVGKTNAGKSQKKGGLGGRKPLGEISNSSNIALSTQVLKKQNPKTSGKVQTRSRRALSDISNSEKAYIPEASKANKKALTLSVLEEDSLEFPSCIPGERFLHDHSKCIAANQHNNLREILATVGFADVLMKSAESPAPVMSNKAKAETRPFNAEMEEINLLAEESFSELKFISSPVCRSPESPIHRDTLWDFIPDFELSASP